MGEAAPPEKAGQLIFTTETHDCMEAGGRATHGALPREHRGFLITAI